MTTALVLSGGAAQGSFEVGALQYLYEREFVANSICATSVGSEPNILMDLMVMLVVNHEWMCNLPGLSRASGRTCSDMEAVDLQLEAAKALEARLVQASGCPGRGFYRIVRTHITQARADCGGLEAGRLKK